MAIHYLYLDLRLSADLSISSIIFLLVYFLRSRTAPLKSIVVLRAII